MIAWMTTFLSCIAKNWRILSFQKRLPVLDMFEVYVAKGNKKKKNQGMRSDDTHITGAWIKYNQIPLVSYTQILWWLANFWCLCRECKRSIASIKTISCLGKLPEVDEKSIIIIYKYNSSKDNLICCLKAEAPFSQLLSCKRTKLAFQLMIIPLTAIYWKSRIQIWMRQIPKQMCRTRVITLTIMNFVNFWRKYSALYNAFLKFYPKNLEN